MSQTVTEYGGVPVVADKLIWCGINYIGNGNITSNSIGSPNIE